jgi:ATP-dependent DNA helicase RecG
VEFRGQGYCRAGTSKTKLANHPEKARRLWSQGVDWSAAICDGASLADLDPEAIAKAREQFQIKHPLQAQELTSWDDRTFLNKARLLRQGAITHTAVLLLGRSEAATLLSPAVAGDFQERCRRLAPIQAACRNSSSSLAVVSSGGSLIQTTSG